MMKRLIALVTAALFAAVSIIPPVFAQSGRSGINNPATVTYPVSVARGGTGVTTSTGSGSVVLGTSPNFTTGFTVNSGTAFTSYVEGTWSPSVSFGGASVGVTASIATGAYTRIGNVVYAWFRIVLTSKGSSTGAALVTGLPLTIKNDNNNYGAGGSCTNWSNFAAGDTGAIIVGGNPNTTTLIISKSGGAGTNTNLADTNFLNTTVMQCSVMYFV